MASDLLVPMDDSEMAECALEFALDEHPDAEVTVLHVVGAPSPMMGEAASVALADDFDKVAEQHAEDVFDRAHEIAADRDQSIDTDLAFGHPARAIVGCAEEFDVVVMGAHGGSLSDRMFVGNVAEKVFQRSPVPVTSVR